MDMPITVHLIMALVGGAIGGLRAAGRPNKNAIVRLTDVLAGLAAAAASSVYVPKELPLLGLGYGMVAGMTAGYALDLVFCVLPRLLDILLRVKFGWKDK